MYNAVKALKNPLAPPFGEGLNPVAVFFPNKSATAICAKVLNIRPIYVIIPANITATISNIQDLLKSTYK